MTVRYDEHESCKRALHQAYADGAERQRIREVVYDQGGVLTVLPILRVDLFEDGVRVLVGGVHGTSNNG